MSRGRRYSNEPKLNMKKVFAVALIFIFIIVFVIAFKKLMSSDTASSKMVSTTYFLINKDNKWGVIDNNSKTIIEPIYDDAIIIPNNKKDIFICNYDIDYTNGTYKTKILNSKNKELFTQYEEISVIENYDTNNNFWYEDGALKVKKDGKYGLINFSGNEILELKYKDIYSLKGTENSLITVDELGKLGLVNNKGQQIVPNLYQEIQTLGENNKTYIIKENDKYGIYGVLECKFQEIKSFNDKNIFCVKEGNTYKVINKENETIFNEKFTSIENIKDNKIIYKNANKYYAYDITTQKIISNGYDKLIYTTNDLFIFNSQNKYGIINSDNEIKIEAKYDNISYYSNANIYELEITGNEENGILNKDLEEFETGIISEVNKDKSYIKLWSENGYKYYTFEYKEKKVQDILVQNNLFLSKKDNKYGFINKNGDVIVDYIYDDATEQNEFGYAAVKQNGLWGCINKNGVLVTETKYNLDNNNLIDFIGQYHIGIDLNLMYYTDKVNN